LIHVIIKILFILQVEGKTVDWTLGFFLSEIQNSVSGVVSVEGVDINPAGENSSEDLTLSPNLENSSSTLLHTDLDSAGEDSTSDVSADEESAYESSEVFTDISESSKKVSIFSILQIEAFLRNLIAGIKDWIKRLLRVH
jgi:hypothetical protein